MRTSGDWREDQEIGERIRRWKWVFVCFVFPSNCETKHISQPAEFEPHLFFDILKGETSRGFSARGFCDYGWL